MDPKNMRRRVTSVTVEYDNHAYSPPTRAARTFTSNAEARRFYERCLRSNLNPCIVGAAINGHPTNPK